MRTVIQLPDELHHASKGLCGRLEISLSELVRRGLEHMIAVSPTCRTDAWALPEARRLGGADPFAAPSWRANLHAEGRRVAERGLSLRARRPSA